MPTFVVEGGKRLKGELSPQGAKNEALQVICATLLTEHRIVIHNIPLIRDVLMLISFLQEMGVTIEKIDDNSYAFCAADIQPDYLETPEFYSKATQLRGSIMILGPLLSRFQRVIIPRPGGDKIGRRRLDTHFNGVEKLGAQVFYDEKNSLFRVRSKKLKGTYMLLEEASVTGTANIIMAATLAEGETIIYNAACEPYIQQLCKMLSNMGSKIEGIGSNLLKITGVKLLSGTEHTILPDMVEIGSFIGLAALTQSEITIKNVCLDQLGIIPDSFQKLGIKMEFREDDIFIPTQKSYKVRKFIDGSILTLSDAIWPGLTPDLLSVLLVTAIQAKGTTLIHQKMFESRLFFVDKLIEMGAQIILCDPHRATIIGLDRETQLKAISMTSPDIRAGVSLLIAALSAKGISTIKNIEQIDRGYQNIDLRLNAIGADIRRIN